jgi:hypothetical protein
VAGPIAIIDFPEQLFAGLRSERMWARANQRHVALQHVDQLWQLIDAGAANKRTDASDAQIIAQG